MISWIQRTFQQHFRTIFMVLLALTIISFVFTIGAPGIGRADSKVVSRPFFGLNLASQEDQQRLVGDAALSVNLQVGYMGLESGQLQDYALQRRAGLHLADQLHVPAPSATELAAFLKALRAFAGEDGQFDAKRYGAFRDTLKTNPRLNEATVGRVLADDWRAEHVQRLLGGPGYVLPGDVKSQLARADSSWTITVATADYASFDPSLKPTDADLTKFFGENSFRYQFPPRAHVSYVDYPAANFISQVSATEDEAKAYYAANPGRFPKPAAAKDAKEVKVDAAADFATVRPQVVAALRLERAQHLAVKAASDLAFTLYEGKVVAGPALDAVLAAQKLILRPLAPFTQETGPAELGGSPEVAAEAFKLGKDRYFSDALNIPAGAAVLFWQETLPSRMPLLAEVREKVAADFVENGKRQRFVELGKTLRSQLESRLKAGDSFDKAISSAGLLAKLEAKTFAPFTLRQPPPDADNSILGALERLDQGQVSEMIITKDKGYFVYAANKKFPDLSEANPQYAATKAQLATYSARINAKSYLAELVAQELKKTEPVGQ